MCKGGWQQDALPVRLSPRQGRAESGARMTKFIDGPAAGTVLSLRRAPLYLRAVQNADGNWDALDQLDDTPEPDETVTVYRRVGSATTVHLHGTKISGWYAMATYELHAEQPSIEECRDTAKWQDWVHAQVKASEPTKSSEPKEGPA